MTGRHGPIHTQVRGTQSRPPARCHPWHPSVSLRHVSVPKTCPQRTIARSHAASRVLNGACSSGSDRLVRDFAGPPLLTEEVLCRAGQHVDLQALCRDGRSLRPCPVVTGRCCAVLAQTTELADLQVLL